MSGRNKLLSKLFIKKICTTSPRSCSKKLKEGTYYTEYVSILGTLRSSYSQISTLHGFRVCLFVFLCDVEAMTSVYSWGKIKNIPVFHHKVKTKLAVSFTCQYFPEQNFYLVYLLNLYSSCPMQYLSQVLNCCLEKWGIWKPTFFLHWIAIGALSEFLFIKNEFLGLNHQDKENNS